MYRTQLAIMLAEIAKQDLAPGAELAAHPCSIAIKALDQAIDDIDYLKQIINGTQTKRAKRAVYLIKLNYDPDF